MQVERDIVVMVHDATNTSTTTFMDSTSTTASVTASTRSRRSRADIANERMEVHMQMEAIRAEVRESFFQRNSNIISSSEAAEVPSVIGQQKPWEVLEMLGKGATGEVYKCKWRGLTVAIKKINFQVLSSYK